MAKFTFRIILLIVVLFLALLMISPKLSTGIVVKSVEKNSTAYTAGIRQGMLIQEIDGKTIGTLADYTTATEAINYTNASRISIKTNSDEFVYLGTTLSDITVGQLPRTNIKTGLDLSGGARAIIRPANATLSQSEINDLVAVTSQRLNAFGLSDISVRPAKDLEGNNFMIVEIAGATPKDVQDLLGKQGEFEGRIKNETVFEGGDKDIADVCRTDASCASVTNCFKTETGYACNFRFAVYLKESAAQKHADITREIPLDESGQYLSEKLYFYIDGTEVDSLLVSANLRGQVATEISIQGSGSGTTHDEALEDARANMNRLQTILITGRLPYKLEIVKLDTISPSLGKEFTKSIFFLGAVVFLIVSVAIFIKYRRVKVTLAVILTMFSEAFITLGIAALIRWNLDAPGLAGIIAGIGTGVNDQIVILDESFAGEKDSTESLPSRIKRALFIIVGAFLTIIASMLPLFWAGAGLLRGFALTTIIGVSVGILITRPAFADIIKKIGE